MLQKGLSKFLASRMPLLLSFILLSSLAFSQVYTDKVVGKKNEDFIWLLVDKIPFLKIKKPTINDALRFCIEMEPEEAMTMIGGHVPFTVHAYGRYGEEFWKKYME